MTEERSQLRVLLVDDDVTIGVMLSIGLPDVELVEANSIADARQILAGDVPDALVVDRRLPDGDGLTLVRDVRRRFATSRTPIVVLTAGHDEADRVAVTRAGADRYLAKPIDPDVLVGHVASVLAIVPADRRGQRVDASQRAASGEIDLREDRTIDLRERRHRWSLFRRRTG